MAALSPDELNKGPALAHCLRREGRADDALVIATLVRAVEPTPTYCAPDVVAQRIGVSRQTVVNWIELL